MKLKKWNGSSWVQEYPEVDVNSIVATGTPSSTTYLRGDGSWATVTSGTTFTGGTITGNIEIENTLPKLTLTDTNNNSDYHIANNNGILEISDTTNQAARIQIGSTGNITLPSTGGLTLVDKAITNSSGALLWDGDEIYHEGHKPTLAELGAAAASHTHTFASLTSKPTTLSGYGITDAYSSSNPSGYQTAAQVATSISNLVDSSPAALDTLNELAAALGDDPNFATTVSNSIGTKVSKSGDTMTGGLQITTGATESGIRFRSATGDFVGRYSNYVSLYNQLNGSVEIKLPDSGNATIGGNAIFHDGYHPNADKLTTARNIALTGAVTGNANFDGSGNISIATTNTADPTLTISGDGSGSATFTNLGNASLSLTNNFISERAAITYGAGGLQWTDTSGNGGAGTNGAAPANPTNEWWHHLVMNHANSAGYYVDIAAAFHSDDIYFRRNVAGSLQSWREIIHSANIGSQNVDRVDGYHIVVGSTGTDTNTLYFTT